MRKDALAESDKLLIERGCDVLKAESYDEALGVLAAKKIAACITDLFLPASVDLTAVIELELRGELPDGAASMLGGLGLERACSERNIPGACIETSAVTERNLLAGNRPPAAPKFFDGEIKRLVEHHFNSRERCWFIGVSGCGHCAVGELFRHRLVDR